MGSENLSWACSQTYFNHQGDCFAHEERNRIQQGEGNSTRDQGYPSPPPLAHVAGAPYLHIYNLYAHHGEHITDNRMGSSVQHTAVDIVYDEGSLNIRIWYSTPPNE